MAMLMCEAYLFSQSALGLNSAISKSQNAGIDNVRKSGNDVANVGCSSSVCVDANKLSMQNSRRSEYRLGASRRKKILGGGIEEE